jgi:hypothetical protein
MPSLQEAEGVRNSSLQLASHFSSPCTRGVSHRRCPETPSGRRHVGADCRHDGDRPALSGAVWNPSRVSIPRGCVPEIVFIENNLPLIGDFVNCRAWTGGSPRTSTEKRRNGCGVFLGHWSRMRGGFFSVKRICIDPRGHLVSGA